MYNQAISLMNSVLIYYQSNARLKSEGFHSLVEGFLKKRIGHTFADRSCEFVEFDDITDLRPISKDPADVIIVTTLLHPLLDLDLLKSMMDAAITKTARIEAKGAVPGTTPLFVCRADLFNKPDLAPYYVYSQTQRQYNSQLNLGRMRRAKIFKALAEKKEDLHQMSLGDILDYLGSKEGTALVIGYGESIPLEYPDRCPLCHSASFSPVYADGCQPLTGFLTRHSEYYFLCHDCGLVFANPRMPEKELWRYYDRYSYDVEWNAETLKQHYDHLDHLNTSHFYNYTAVLPYLQRLPAKAEAVDLGGGEGEFVVFLKQHFPTLDVHLWDYRVSSLFQNELNRRGISTRQINFLNETLGEASFDLISNWEVIEHLPVEKLAVYFKKIYAALRPGGMYLFSTPDFDNPYSHVLDFWAITPGEHLSVLSRRVLEPLLTACGFTIIGEHHECVSLKTKDRWFKYGEECSASMAGRAEARVINDFLRDETILEQHLNFLRQKNLGSELILCCQKK